MCVLETRILLWVAASRDAESKPPAWLPPTLGAEESSRLLAAAVREGLAGLLYHRLKGSGRLTVLAAAARHQLETIYYRTLQTNLRFLSALQEIAAQEVPFVLMQGAALLLHIYPDPGLRPLTDLDLWVLPRHRERLSAALSHLGFEEDSLTPGVFSRGAILVDVHEHLDWAERIRTSRFLFAADAEEIYRRCRPRSHEAVPVLCLDSYDQVTYLMVHAIKHNLERLMWLADIQRLVAEWESPEWEAWRLRARVLGQEGVAAVLSYLRQVLFEMPTPAALAAGSKLTALGRYLLRRRKKGPLPKWSSLELLSTGSRVRQLEFAFESMFPRPEILRQVFADRASLRAWQLYGLRIRQLLSMLG
jgi:hypothetical protein